MSISCDCCWPQVDSLNKISALKCFPSVLLRISVFPIELIIFFFCVSFLSQKMDMNGDGVVTLDEFLDCCRNDDAISRSMAVFDSSF